MTTDEPRHITNLTLCFKRLSELLEPVYNDLIFLSKSCHTVLKTYATIYKKNDTDTIGRHIHKIKKIIHGTIERVD